MLLTGSNGGLGETIAKKLLEKNYDVILQYHVNKENVQKLAEEYPSQTYLLQGDVANENDVIHMKKECDEANLKVDILINNAGIDHVSEMEEKTSESMLKVFKVNTLGPFLMSKTFGSDIDQRKGVIINISSDNTIDQNDYVTLEYDISKSGLNMLTKDLSLYFTNTCVNAIAFPWLDTNQNSIPKDIKKFINFMSLDHAAEYVLDLIDKKETGKIEVVKE